MRLIYSNGLKLIDGATIKDLVEGESGIYAVDDLEIVVTNNSISTNLPIEIDVSVYSGIFDKEKVALMNMLVHKINNLSGELKFNSLDGQNGSLPDGTQVIVNGLSGVYTVTASFPFYNGEQIYMNQYEVTKDGKKCYVPSTLIRSLDDVQSVNEG